MTESKLLTPRLGLVSRRKHKFRHKTKAQNASKVFHPKDLTPRLANTLTLTRKPGSKESGPPLAIDSASQFQRSSPAAINDSAAVLDTEPKLLAYRFPLPVNRKKRIPKNEGNYFSRKGNRRLRQFAPDQCTPASSRDIRQVVPPAEIPTYVEAVVGLLPSSRPRIRNPVPSPLLLRAY